MCFGEHVVWVELLEYRRCRLRVHAARGCAIEESLPVTHQHALIVAPLERAAHLVSLSGGHAAYIHTELHDLVLE